MAPIMYIVGIMWTIDIVYIYVYSRQYFAARCAENKPMELVGIITDESYQAMRTSEQNNMLTFVTVTLVSLLYKTVSLITHKAVTSWENTAHYTRDPVYRVVIYDVMRTIVTHIPFIILKHLYILSSENSPRDKVLAVLAYLFGIALECGVTAATTISLVAIINQVGSDAIMYMWVMSTLFGTALATLYIDKVIPLTHGTLEEGPVKQKLSNITALAGFPLSKIFIEPRGLSNTPHAYNVGVLHSNAFILSEPLITDFDVDEIGGVVAHELGHWRLGHINFFFWFFTIESLIVFYMLSQCYGNNWLFRLFGFNLYVDPPHPIIGCSLAFNNLLPIFKKITSRLWSKSSRACEFAADEYAISIGEGHNVKDALLKMTVMNRDFPVCDHLYSIWFRTHPHITERLAKINLGIRDLN